jgi:DNA-binding response OmpR family regulator
MKPHKILLIDDDSDFLTALKLRCQQIGLEVCQAHNLLTALVSIEKNPPDVICLDVEMPTGNGLNFCDMLRKDERTKEIPIAIVTGNQALTTRNACQRMGVHYVSKSSRFWAELEPVIKKMLGCCPQTQVEIDGHQELLDAAFAILTSDPEESKVDDLSDRDSDIQKPVPTPTILCIDDDSDFYQALSLRFAEHGISVLHAKEGIEGYRTAFVSPICAILLDYNMPNGRGDYILSRLMDNPVTKDIPVIVLTGHNDKMLERKMLAMGAKAYIQKPFEFGQLKNAVTAAIGS